MVHLIANERFPYGASHLNRGDRFEETEKFAEILTALGKARYMTDSELEKWAIIREVVFDYAGKIISDSARMRERPKDSKNKYSRRDMRAED